MKIYLEYKDEKSQKFWEATVEDEELIIRYGKIGSDGQVKNKICASESMAEYEMHKAVIAKRAKGYAMPNAITMDELKKFEITNVKDIDSSLYSNLEGEYNNFIVIDEDITLKELDLDSLHGLVDGIIINTNLKVDGGIINSVGDYGIALVVTGSVEADFVIGGGSEIYLEGENKIATFAIGEYNHGSLDIADGSLPISLNNAHCMAVPRSTRYKFDLFDNSDDIDNFGKIFGTKVNFIEKDYDTYSIDMDEIIDIVIDDKQRVKFYLKILKGMNADKPLLAKVKKNGLAIRDIENPSDELKMGALQNYGLVLEFIENPTENMKIVALKETGLALEFIENPSDKMISIALKETYWAIKYVENPTEKMKLFAIKSYGGVIEHIDNISEEMKLLAVSGDPSAIYFIENPSEELQYISIKDNPDNLRFIDKPTLNIQMEAVKKDIFIISHIKQPNHSMQNYVMDKNPSLFNYIDSPSKETLTKAEKLIATGEITTPEQLKSQRLKDFVKNNLSIVWLKTHYGDLIIDGNHRLFENKKEPIGLYITGDLIVSGVLSTSLASYTNLLVVGGSMKADSFINDGNASIYIEKNIEIKNIAFIKSSRPVYIGGKVKSKHIIFYNELDYKAEYENKFDFATEEYQFFAEELYGEESYQTTFYFVTLTKFLEEGKEIF